MSDVLSVLSESDRVFRASVGDNNANESDNNTNEENNNTNEENKHPLNYTTEHNSHIRHVTARQGGG